MRRPLLVALPIAMLAVLSACGGSKRIPTGTVHVAVSSDERVWLKKVEHPASLSAGLQGGGRTRLTALQTEEQGKKVLAAVAASGATPIRLTIRPAPALVLATATPAAYLKHRLGNVLRVVGSGRHASFVEVVDRKGAKVFEFSYVPGEGSLYVRPDLDQCSPVMHSELVANPPPPCPAS